MQTREELYKILNYHRQVQQVDETLLKKGDAKQT